MIYFIILMTIGLAVPYSDSNKKHETIDSVMPTFRASYHFTTPTNGKMTLNSRFIWMESISIIISIIMIIRTEMEPNGGMRHQRIWCIGKMKGWPFLNIRTEMVIHGRAQSSWTIQIQQALEKGLLAFFSDHRDPQINTITGMLWLG